MIKCKKCGKSLSQALTVMYKAALYPDSPLHGLCHDCRDAYIESEYPESNPEPDPVHAENKQRGGVRPGAGRKPLKPALKKHKKAFSLSPESVHALADLQEFLCLGSQSAVVEFLVLKAFRELSNRALTEHQREIFPDPDSEEILF